MFAASYSANDSSGEPRRFRGKGKLNWAISQLGGAMGLPHTHRSHILRE